MMNRARSVLKIEKVGNWKAGNFGISYPDNERLIIKLGKTNHPVSHGGLHMQLSQFIKASLACMNSIYTTVMILYYNYTQPFTGQ